MAGGICELNLRNVDAGVWPLSFTLAPALSRVATVQHVDLVPVSDFGRLINHASQIVPFSASAEGR
jgi:hypothetical protein